MPLALYIMSGERKGEVVPLEEGRPITVGRSAANAIRLPDRKLSRIHCQFQVIGGRCQVMDLNSTNGTLVNGQRIQGEVWLEPDDEVEIGMSRLRLAEISPAEAALAEAERPARAATRTCEECGRPIPEEDVASGRARSVGERFYCRHCMASFDEATVREPAAPTSHRAPALEPGTEIAGVRIVEVLGEGRLGRIYKGEQVSMRRHVALKTIHVNDEDWTQKYLNAVYASGQLVHQNVCLIFDTGEEDGLYYVVREYVEGVSLDRRLAERKALALSEAYSIVTQVAYALEYAAERHVLHGNLSPRKILIGNNGIVKVTGFGLPQTPPRGMDESDYRWAALPYTAPERLHSEGALDFATDLYSLVAIFYHAVTGRPPFTASTVSRLEGKILKRTPRPLSDFVEGIPDIAQHIVDRGLTKDPMSRYQTPRELLYEFEERLRREI